MRVAATALLSTVVLALTLGAAPSHAGCWAEVELAPPPAGLSAGTRWSAEILVLQHGQTPLAGAAPTVTVASAERGTRRTYAARPTGETGVYRADVVFPAPGAWRYEVYDGFVESDGSTPCARTHALGTVSVGPVDAAPAAASPADSGSVSGGDAAAVLAALVLGLSAGALIVVRRRRATARRGGVRASASP